MFDPSHPLSTYRLQLHRGFGFGDAARLSNYLRQLGVGHAYLSPILMARPGSTHGYDLVDPRRINPELGTLDEFRALVQSLRDNGIGIVLDIVPNHMAIGGASNLYWLDVLRNGSASRYAHWFDIDWCSLDPRLTGKVLLPFLGTSLAEAIVSGALHFSESDGEPAVWIGEEHKLPIDPRSFTAPPDSPEAMAALIVRQHWLPARYSAASFALNYRRFFAVSHLAGLRIEDDHVFDEMHALIFHLVDEGLVDGLRIDHIDGLREPGNYLRRLRQACPRPVWLVVEKILGAHERLPVDWPVDGTTGYETLGRLVPVLTGPTTSIRKAYADFVGPVAPFAQVERDAKFDLMAEEFPTEVDAVARRLATALTNNPVFRELPIGALREGLRQVLASFSVYRTYADSSGQTAQDRRELGLAIARARKSAPWLDTAVFDALASCFEADDSASRDAILRLQQLSGPLMAKGLEDTALYRHGALLAVNDVGARPDRLHADVASFHDFCRARVHTPGTMNAGSTHDSKRGEDARARLSVLGAFGSEWGASCRKWRDNLLRSGIPPLDDETLWYLFQTLFGAWPIAWPSDGGLDGVSLGVFAERVQAAMQKAVREARVHSRWVAPDEAYEQRLAATIDTILDRDDTTGVLASFRAFEAQLRPICDLQVLIATTLRLSMPGVPDIYQGSELAGQAMVDPDNRRPVDFGQLQAVLHRCEQYRSLWEAPRREQKLDLVRRLLHVRRAHAEAFGGTYTPLAGEGRDEARLLAYERRAGQDAVVVAAVLHPCDGRREVSLPLPKGIWRDALSNTAIEADAGSLLSSCPLAVLVNGGGDSDIHITTGPTTP